MTAKRKGLSRWLISGAVFALTLVPAVARAGSTVQVVLDGQPLEFDVPPVIEQNVTMVPVRALLTPLGASFNWNHENQTVTATLNGTEIQAMAGSPTARVNGKAVPLAMPVQNTEGRTLIPLRFFAEEMGFTVEWQVETKTVLLSSQVVSREAAGRTESVSREAVRRKGDLVVARAVQNIGVNYAWGGISPETGFDCSGLVYYLGEQVGVELSRTSHEQFDEGIAIKMADLAAGDLVFFTTYAPGASHVGVYDGAGGFIHAQSPEAGVVRTPMTSEWWASRYVGARRVFR